MTGYYDLLKRYGVKGVPTIVFLGSDRKQRASTLHHQIITWQISTITRQKYPGIDYTSSLLQNKGLNQSKYPPAKPVDTYFGTLKAVCYAVFLMSFFYAIGFVGDFVVPKSINSGSQSSLLHSLIIYLALLSLFAVQHTILARPAFKAGGQRLFQFRENGARLSLSPVVFFCFFIGSGSPYRV